MLPESRCHLQAMASTWLVPTDSPSPSTPALNTPALNHPHTKDNVFLLHPGNGFYMVDAFNCPWPMTALALRAPSTFPCCLTFALHMHRQRLLHGGRPHRQPLPEAEACQQELKVGIPHGQRGDVWR